MGVTLIAEDQKRPGDPPVEPECQDHYRQFIELPLSAVFYPLGFPLRLSTNCARILEAAEETWGDFTQAVEMPPIQVNIGLIEDGSTECPPEPLNRAQRNLMVRIADAANYLVIDIRRSFSFGWLGSAAVSHRNYLRYQIIEASALCHIADRYTAPVHAACVERQGHGVLLCGDSGAGKSSLAYACARAGWTYITDDASYVLHGSAGRQVVGNCHVVRLRSSAAELFEGLTGRSITARPNGKPSIEIRVAGMPEIRRAPTSNVDFLVFLRRGDAAVQELVPYPVTAARSYNHNFQYAMEEMHDAQIATVERLLSAQIFELRYRDLDWAVERLDRMVGERG
jgi:hypothetical protein